MIDISSYTVSSLFSVSPSLLTTMTKTSAKKQKSKESTARCRAAETEEQADGE
jgi:hypothetical protein